MRIHLNDRVVRVGCGVAERSGEGCSVHAHITLCLVLVVRAGAGSGYCDC